jgi:Oxidoreductase family, NAD-binding Rossmann fold
MPNEITKASSDVSRRGFLKLGGMTAVGLRLSSAAVGEGKSHSDTVIGMPFTSVNPKIGIIGVGARGTILLRNLLRTNAQILAICDIVPEKAANAQSMVEKAGQKTPTLYTNGDNAFESLVKSDDLDLVIIATPWNWHVEMAVATMKNGKHAAVEVPAATTIEDCWKLVDTSEQTRRHCVMLEECCYGYNETLVLRMAHAGLLGTLLYGEGGYLHDLRKLLFSTEPGGPWRLLVETQRNGNLYPTHGLGPVANYMGIQRGDRFDSMVSMSTPPRGLDEYRKEHLPPQDPRWSQHYINGDISTSLIKTAKGLTITLKYDFTNPRPYSRINEIAGTKGIFADFPPRLYLDGQQGGEKWGTLDGWKQYEYPFWKDIAERAAKMGGEGSMDYIMLYRLIQCMRKGLPPDMDVYDAAAWSAPGPLSSISIERRSAPVNIPDFTRGHWQVRSASAIATESSTFD